MKSIFHFKRDLRVQDNRALALAGAKSSELFCVFILDPQFLQKCPQNDPRLGFLQDALENLDRQIKKLGGEGLNIFYGNSDEVLKKLRKKHEIKNYFSGKSLSLTGQARDEKIKHIFGEENFFLENDSLLVETQKIETRKVFSAFYRQWQKIPKIKPLKKISGFSAKKFPENSEISQIFSENISFAKNLYWKIPENISAFDFFSFQFEDYEQTRNLVYDEFSTTKVSPFLRFGLVSLRQVFDALLQFPFDTEVFQKELAWREFWVHIQERFPETQTQAFQAKRRYIQWDKNNEFLEKWKKGETGYPIIDAAMRQLNQENWMHNRARMFTASFLTKNLHINWREGEKYFSEKLLDYDDPINIGNWQWSSSVGADPKPLRIFSPLLQAQRFDPNAEYIKKYIPELSHIEPKKLHDPHKLVQTQDFASLQYPAPIVDAKTEAKIAKQRFFESGEIFGSVLE